MSGYAGGAYGAETYPGGGYAGPTPPPPPPPPPPPVVTARFPTVTVELSTTGPLAAPSWQDLGNVVRSITISRGRSDESSEFDAGTCEIILRNDDRAFDPMHAASPWAGYLTTNRRVRVRATWAGTTYPLFDGYADLWEQISGGAANTYGECRLVLTDLFKILARLTMEATDAFTLDDPDDGELDTSRLAGPFEFREENAQSRALAILETVEIPPGSFAVDATATQLVADVPDRTGDVLTYLRRIAASIGGHVLCGPDGRVLVWDRTHWTRVDSQRVTTGLWSDDRAAWALRFASIDLIAQDERTISNIVERGRNDETVWRKRSRTSIATYGPNTDSRTDLLTADPYELMAQVETVLARQLDPRPRIAEFTIIPLRAPATYWPQVLGRDIHDRFTLSRKPAQVGTAYTAEYRIDSIAHQIVPGGWQTTWTASLAEPLTGFVLNSSTLNSSATLTY